MHGLLIGSDDIGVSAGAYSACAVEPALRSAGPLLLFLEFYLESHSVE